METIILASLVFLALLVLAAILNMQNKILKELKNIPPPPQKMEFPKIEFPKVEIPPAKEYTLDLNPVIEAIKNIQIPAPQKIEFPKIEFPKVEIPAVEIPPAKEYVLDLNPVIEAIKNIQISAPQKEEGNINTDVLQETATLMRVNQAEFQSSLEAFHKAIDKLLAQIPNGEKELDVQKEFMQKFEDAFVKIQEKSTEAISENSLRLQEILTEFLNKENNK
jgi:hypothetical protein